MNQISSMDAAQPHSVEAEQQLLGAILSNNDLFFKVATLLRVEHFYDPVHARIYDVAATMINDGKLASPVTLKPIFATDEGLSGIGGVAYLVRMVAASVSSSQLSTYAELIVEQYTRRDTIRAAQETIASLMGGGDPAVAIAALQQALLSAPTAGKEPTQSFLSAMTSSIQNMSAMYRGEVETLRTGLDPLDKVLGGLAAGDLMVLGGATSMGKTATAVAIADRLASTGRSVAFWSREMTPENLVERIVSSRCGIPYSKARDASKLSEDEFRKWVEASRGVGDLPIRIIPKHIMSLAGGQAAAQRAKREFGPDKPLSMLIVDYGQLIEGIGNSRYEKMSSIPTVLKHMGDILGVPVICLVQLDRKIGERLSKRPNLNDIKESGQFENDADQVVFCYRPSYYLEREGPEVGKDGTVSMDARADWEADMKAAKNKIELIVGKNRHGGLAIAEMGVHMPTNKFWNVGDDTEGFE